MKLFIEAVKPGQMKTNLFKPLLVGWLLLEKLVVEVESRLLDGVQGALAFFLGRRVQVEGGVFQPWEGPALRKGAGLELVQQWFAVARGMRTAAGFAVGRTIYMVPVSAWLTAAITREDAVRQIADTYVQLVEAWMG